MQAVALLEAQNVVKRFGGLTAVNNVSLAVEKNSIVSVIGPNGAGKTTFFNIVTGIYQPDSGTIMLDGQPLIGLRPDQIAARGITRTFQNIRLFNNMTVLENVLVGMHPRLTTNVVQILFRSAAYYKEEQAAYNHAMELLHFVRLDHRADDLARSLAYGEQRRLEIARALASNPKLILLDEPAAGMNPQETEEATDLIRRLRDDLGVTVVLIEHDMSLVMQISEQITVLDYGRPIAFGTPNEIRYNPRVIEAYLGQGAAAEMEPPHDASGEAPATPPAPPAQPAK
jgi:branched-chain amino acid transport system ATP-binding protein